MDAIRNANPELKQLWSFSIPLETKFLNGRSQFLHLINQEVGFVLPPNSSLQRTKPYNVVKVAIFFEGKQAFTFHSAVEGQALHDFNTSVNYASARGFPIVMKLHENKLLVRIYSLNSDIDQELSDFHKFCVSTINDEKEDSENP